MMPLSVGTIGKIEGTETVQQHPAVCNYLQYYAVGDTMDQKKVGTLGQQFCRITFLADTEEEVFAGISAFQSVIKVYDTDGNLMNNQPFDVQRLK